MKPRPKPLSLVERKDGRSLRRMTLYLPPELARELKRHCAETDEDMSVTASEAVRAWLAQAQRTG